MKFDEPETLDHEEFYVIRLKFRGERLKPGTRNTKEHYDFYVFYKSKRYTAYCGNLQTETDPRLAYRWKTPDGAHTAMANLQKKGVIRSNHEPVVYKYTRTVTRCMEAVLADTTANVGEILAAV